MTRGSGRAPRRPGAPATLATIAQAARVHPSTVSRALSSDERIRRTVSASTASAVRAVAEELGYRPNLAGATLRTGRSRTLGVLVPKLTDIVLADIYEGIEAAAAEAGYYTFVSNTQDDPRLHRERLQSAVGRGVDGVLLGDARQGGGLAAELRALPVPAVLFNRQVRGPVSVTIDDPAGGALVGEHLCSLGHTVMGVVAGWRYASTGRERAEGFRVACAGHGVEVPDERVVYSGFDVAAGRRAAQQLLSRRPRPTAIFAVNDFAAIGVMGAVRDAGLRVGRDIAVVGYNDVPLAAELPVPLTSVWTPRVEMGRLAVSTLLSRLDGREVSSSRLPPTLVVRDSSQASRAPAPRRGRAASTAASGATPPSSGPRRHTGG